MQQGWLSSVLGLWILSEGRSAEARPGGFPADPLHLSPARQLLSINPLLPKLQAGDGPGGHQQGLGFPPEMHNHRYVALRWPPT